jgi:DnaJ family protein C protein 27
MLRAARSSLSTTQTEKAVRLQIIANGNHNDKHNKDNANMTAPLRQYQRIKIISMGDTGVGKSCIIKRYCEKKFVARWISTIGVDFGVRNVRLGGDNGGGGGDEVKVNFWDMSGNADFRDVRVPFYADAQGALLVYDVTERKSFAALDNWVREWLTHGSRATRVFVCANKVDASLTAKQRKVSADEGRRWAKEKGFRYFETSAKDGTQCSEMFTALFAAAVDVVTDES